MDAVALPDCAMDAWLRQFDRILILAPHPDDELFGCYALMAKAQTLQLNVQVHVLTDGELCFGALPAAETAALRRTRQSESVAAAQYLGYPLPHFWQLPDAQLMQHAQALQDMLRPLCTPRTLCVATWTEDSHPDHEAVGLCVQRLQQQQCCTALYYPVWSLVDPVRHAQWHAQSGTHYTLQLSPLQHAQKRAAAQLFRSQLQSGDGASHTIVAAPTLQRFVSLQEHYWHEH